MNLEECLSNSMELELSDKVSILEWKMLELPQADCPVRHIFGPGIYIREVHLKAGTFAIGHYQKHKHMNVMLSGRVLMLQEDGEFVEIVAPITYVGDPGRKVGYIVEDVVWQNIYATEETDIDTLESMFLDKSQAYEQWRKNSLSNAVKSAEKDRLDYIKALDEIGLDDEVVRLQSEFKDDQIDMPYPVHPYRIAESAIHGLGYFLTYPANAGDILAPARIRGMRTPAGRFVNHSVEPNARMAIGEDGNIYLVATRSISGCIGGWHGEEVTVDYRSSVMTAFMAKQKEGAACLV